MLQRGFFLRNIFADMTPSAHCEVGSPGNVCGDAEDPGDVGKTTDECNGTIAETEIAVVDPR
jgi:hypothetical protein